MLGGVFWFWIVWGLGSGGLGSAFVVRGRLKTALGWQGGLGGLYVCLSVVCLLLVVVGSTCCLVVRGR